MLITHKYRFFILISLFIITIFDSPVLAQHVYIPDTILVQNLSDKGLVFEYKVRKGNTIYSISKAFNADLIDLFAFNEGISSKPLGIGDIIYVPFDNQLLDGKQSNNHIVLYKVGKKENLFRIAKMYFGVDIDKVKKLNNLEDNTIQPGQYLKIGSVSFKKIKDHISDVGVNETPEKEKDELIENKKSDKISSDEPKKKIIVKDSIAQKESEKIKEKFDKIIIVNKDSTISKVDSVEVEDEKIFLVSDNGIALWNKRSRTKGVFVLNNDARINSLMEIFNPMLGRKIFAKVIGRIPPNSYPSNVKLILSPQAATSLGAINTKFFVRIKYNKK